MEKLRAQGVALPTGARQRCRLKLLQSGIQVIMLYKYIIQQGV